MVFGKDENEYDIPYLRWSLHGAKVIEENSN